MATAMAVAMASIGMNAAAEALLQNEFDSQPISLQANMAGYRGYAMRGTLMYDDANYRGAVDQLEQALKILGVKPGESQSDYPDDGVAEASMLNRALAVAHVRPDEALRLLSKFSIQFPGSPAYNRVQLAIGDLYFDMQRYTDAAAIYDKLDIKSLNPSDADALEYRRAYCMLMTTDYAGATAIYTRLSKTAEYANASRLYLGYIDYAKGNYKEAEKLLASVKPMPGPTSLAPYYLAQIYYANKDYGKALQCANSVIRRTDVPQEFMAEATRIAGESLYMKGSEKEGIDLLRQYLAMTSAPVPTALYILGVDDYHAGRTKQAIDMLTQVTGQDSSIGQSAYAYIGQAYLEDGNYNAAALALDKAARMTFDPKVQEKAFYNLCVAKTRGGKEPFGNTVGVFEEFIKKYPSSAMAPEVADFLANGYMIANNYPAALAAINAVANPSTNVMLAKQKVLYTLGIRSLQSGNASDALDYLEEAASMRGYDASTQAEATLWMGEAQYRLGNYDEAIEAYNSYLANPAGKDKAIANYDKGYAYYANKEFKDAAKAFRKYIDDKNNTHTSQITADAFNRLADCLYYQSDFAHADETYAQAYQANPSAGDYPRFQQGLMKGLQRNYSGEIASLNSMMEEFPTSALIPSALIEIGQAYNQLGQAPRAIETYTALVSRYPSTAQGRQGRLLLAITYGNSGNRDAAIEHYKRVISEYPTSEEASAAADDLKQIYADRGTVNAYMEFIEAVPSAPRPETAELAELSLQSAQRALESNRLDDAVTISSQLLELYPDAEQAVEALTVKADAEYRLGRSADALQSYKLLAQKASTAADVNAARMGMLRVSRDLADNALTVEVADQLLASSTIGSEGRNEVLFAKAMALRDLGQARQAIEIWNQLGTDTDNLYGTKSAFYKAEYYYTAGQTEKATKAVNALIDANPPYDYWLARAFILYSDILRSEDNVFEANEYLKSLRANYPGNETDIFDMIDSRLEK